MDYEAATSAFMSQSSFPTRKGVATAGIQGGATKERVGHSYVKHEITFQKVTGGFIVLCSCGWRDTGTPIPRHLAGRLVKVAYEEPNKIVLKLVNTEDRFEVYGSMYGMLYVVEHISHPRAAKKGKK